MSLPAIDLADPEVFAASISKANAVARTLLTSDGRILDVTTQGAVKATLQNIETNAANYRRVFVSKDLTSSPARLGLLSQPEGRTLAEVKPWANNQVPRLQDAVVLTPGTANAVGVNTPFKLDRRSTNVIQQTIDLKTIGVTTRLPNRMQ